MRILLDDVFWLPVAVAPPTYIEMFHHMGDDQLAAQQPRSVDRIEQLLIHVAPTTMQRKLYSTGGWKPLWSGGRRRSIHRLRLRRWVRCR